ncbi:hypothetical protein BDR26DRAFT_937054 [Obelidium mucronatum]|nr:hypothetical protein BDR26DRAFT_937054 [Obelidium mucronatum]
MDSDDLAAVASTLLESLHLSDDAYSEYIAQLADDSSMSTDEKQEIIVEFLSDAIEDSATKQGIESVVAELLSKLENAKEAREQAAAAAKAANAAEAQSQPPSSSTVELQVAQQPAKKVLSKEEKKARERLLREYGYEVDEVVENEHGETEFLYSGGGSSKASLPETMQNTNAQRVKEAEQQRRQKLAAGHAAEVERNKAARQKQLDDAEKKKKKTVKQEKRRM